MIQRKQIAVERVSKYNFYQRNKIVCYRDKLPPAITL